MKNFNFHSQFYPVPIIRSGFLHAFGNTFSLILTDQGLKKCSLMIFLIGSLLGISTVSLHAQGLIIDTKWAQPNGQVEAIARDSATVYLGGSFSYVGQKAPYGALIDSVNGSPLSGYMYPNAAVNTSINDGAGGWYAGGDFIQVGDTVRSKLVRINAEGKVEPFFKDYSIDGSVYALQKSGNTLYAGGSFNSITRDEKYGVQIDSATGIPDFAFLNPNASVRNVISDGNKGWYVGGDFTKIGDSLRNYLAHIDSTGKVTAFNPSPDGGVTAILLDGTTLYVSGYFGNIGGESRQFLASVSTTTGLATAWNPQINGVAFAMIKQLSNIVIGGYFSLVNGLERNNAAAINATNGTLTNWNPNVNGGVNALAITSTGIAIGGSFSLVNGQKRDNIAIVQNATGALLGTPTAWNTAVNGTVKSIAVNGTNLILGGEFTFIGLNKPNAAAVDTTSGSLWSNFPDVNGTVTASVSDGYGGWFICGDFTEVGGVKTKNVAHITSSGVANPNFINELRFEGTPQCIEIICDVVDPTNCKLYVGGSFTGLSYERSNGALLNTQNTAASLIFPNFNGVVSSSVPDGNGGWFVGGAFTQVGDSSRSNIVRINSSGSVLPWKADILGAVRKLVVRNDTLFVGGDFYEINGQTIYGATAFSKSTAALLSWNPDVQGSVYDIELDGGTAYLAGSFGSVGGQSRSNLASVSTATGAVTTWNPSPNSAVNSVKISGTTAIIAGSFSQVGVTARNYLARVNTANNTVTSWNPNPDGVVYSLIIDGTNVYIGGDFNFVGASERSGIARLTLSTGAVQAWNPGVNMGYYSAKLRTMAMNDSSVYIGGYFGSAGGENRNFLAALNKTNNVAKSWYPEANGPVESITINGNSLFVGGSFTKIGTLKSSNLIALPIQKTIIGGYSNGVNGYTSHQVNGIVYSLAKYDSLIFLGGGFTIVNGQTRNNLAALHLSTGVLNTWNPNVDGAVYAIRADESGVYAGGSFQYVNNYSQYRPYLAAFYHGFGGVISWNPAPNQAVNCLAISGSSIYAGGYFTNIGGESRGYIAQLDKTTGLASSWNPNADAGVRSIAVRANTVYVAGDFNQIGGQIRNKVAALNNTNGNATSWVANIDGTAYTIAAGNGIFIGGSYTYIRGQSRNFAASVHNSTGVISAWNPNFNNYVNTLGVRGTNVYAGGRFTQVGNDSRPYLAAVNITTGVATSWNPRPNQFVNVIAAQAGKVYAGGDFTQIGAITRNNLVALNATTGEILNWTPNPNGVVYSLLLDSNKLYVGGSFGEIGGQVRNGAASLNTSTGLANAWNPDVYGTVSALVKDGANIFVGGSFNYTNSYSVYRPGLALFDADSGLALPFDANVNGNVSALSLSGNTLYVGGSFSNIGGSTRNNIAAINKSTGIATSWNPNANATVNALIIKGNAIYAGGSFDQIGGQNRPYLAALNNTTGAALTWNPSPDNTVLHINDNAKGLIVGGYFNYFKGKAISNLVALDASTGQVKTNWNPNPNGNVNELLLNGSTLYVGGSFSTIGGQNRNYLAAVSTSTGLATSFNPNPDGGIYALAFRASNLYAGGSFANIGGQTRNNLASLNPSTGVATTWSPNPDGPVYDIKYDGGTRVYVCGSFSSIGGATRYNIASINTANSNATTWDPSANSAVTALELKGSSVFASGFFSNIGGADRRYVAELNTASNLATNWDAGIDYNAYYYTTGKVKVLDSNAYITANSITKGSETRNGLASIKVGSGDLSNFNPDLNNYVSALEVYNKSLLLGGSFTRALGTERSYFTVLIPATVTTNYVQPAPVCAGSGVAVPFNTDFSTLQQREFVAMLSDSLGSFTNATNIGSLATNATSGNISCVIPASAASSNLYKIKVVMPEDPNVNIVSSSAFSVTNTVSPSVSITASESGPFCFGTSVTFQSSLLTDVTPVTYQWKLNNVVVGTGSTYTSASLSDGDVIQLKVKSANPCALPDSALSNTIVVDVNASVSWYLDFDNDGWYAGTQTSCVSPGDGWTNVLPSGGSGDCDDSNFNVNPGTTEVCGNNIDDDCDGNTDEDCSTCVIAPKTPLAITGQANGVCANTPGNYSIASVATATNYVWSTTGDITISGGQGTTNATFNFGASFTTGTVRVQAENSCGISAVRSLAVTSTPATPGIITGQATAVCSGSSGNYSINPVASATNYIWSTTGDITITGGQGTTNATFSFGAGFTNGTVRVQAENSCGISAVRSLTINSVPVTPGLITGQATAVCSGSSGNYSINPVVSATNYIWSTTGDITITGGQGTTNGTFSFGAGFTTGTVRVQAENSCGISAVRSLTINSAPVTPGIIAGQATAVCSGTSGNYSINPVATATNYIWSTTGDISITGGQGTTNVSFSFGAGFSTGTVRVQAENSCGISTVRSLTINSAPVTPGIIAGQATAVCSGTSGNYSINPVATATNYIWSTTGDISITGGQGTTNATFSFGSGFTTGAVRVQAENGCGISVVRSLTINSAPVTPGIIAGQATAVCSGTSGNYSINPVATATNYIWSTTGDISVIGGQGTTNATFSFGSGFTTGTVRVQAENGCGISVVRSLTINSAPVTPGIIAGQATAVCSGTSGNYSINPVATATNYIWSTTGDISITGGQGTTNATFRFGSGFTTGTVRVQAENSCGISVVRSLTINSAPVTPGIITGQATAVCSGTTGNYSISPVATATNYIWSTTGDITITGGQGTTNATFSFGSGFTTGTVRVQAENSCGISVVRSLTVSSLPVTPGLMSGIKTGIVPGTTGEVYSVPNVAGLNYYWETTGGIVIVSGQGTNVVTVDYPLGFTTGVIRVQGQNACGSGAFRSATIIGASSFSFTKSEDDQSLSEEALMIGAQKDLSMTVYPNPTNGVVTIKVDGALENGQYWLSIFDISGREILHQDWSMKIGQAETLDMSNYASGMYLIQLTSDKEVVSQKVVKQ